MKALLVTVLILAATTSFAKKGKVGSGGGNAVVCFNSQATVQKVKSQNNIVYDEDVADVKSVEALDLYEITKGRFQKSRSLFVKSATGPEDFMTKLNDYYNRLYKTEKENYFGNLKAGIPEENIHYVPNPVKNMDDAEQAVEFTADRQCVLTTIIVQSGNDFSVGELTIDERLFNHPKHPGLSRGVFYLHEWVYRPFLKARVATSSLQTQRLVQVYISKRIGSDTFTWLEELRSYGDSPGSRSSDVSPATLHRIPILSKVMTNDLLNEMEDTMSFQTAKQKLGEAVEKYEGKTLEPLAEKIIEIFRNQTQENIIKLSLVLRGSIYQQMVLKDVTERLEAALRATGKISQYERDRMNISLGGFDMNISLGSVDMPNKIKLSVSMASTEAGRNTMSRYLLAEYLRKAILSSEKMP